MTVQKYCSKPDCRKASQAASWQRWFARPENRDYYGEEENVARVRQWRAENPGYWKRCTKATNTLPKMISAQGAGLEADTTELALDALPNVILSEPAMVVGLIASLTGSALPKDIAETSRRFVLLGQDILGKEPGVNPRGGRRDGKKAHSLFRKGTAGAPSVQLGRSPPGAGGIYQSMQP